MDTQYKLDIIHDDSSDNTPRDWDNLGTVAIYHRRYSLSDENAPVDVEGAQYIEESDEYITLPIYMYDHSGITISTTPFSCPWDSGRVGIIFVAKRDIEKEYGDLSEETLEKVRRVLVGEIETYDQFLRGDVWGYRVSRAKVYTAEDGDQITQWEEVDSCWGFYGEEYCQEEGQAVLDSYLTEEAA